MLSQAEIRGCYWTTADWIGGQFIALHVPALNRDVITNIQVDRSQAFKCSMMTDMDEKLLSMMIKYGGFINVDAPSLWDPVYRQLEFAANILASRNFTPPRDDDELYPANICPLRRPYLFVGAIYEVVTSAGCLAAMLVDHIDAICHVIAIEPLPDTPFSLFESMLVPAENITHLSNDTCN